MARRTDPNVNTIKPKFDFNSEVAVAVPSAQRSEFLHQNATRNKHNALNAQKFNEFENMFYSLVDILGDLDTDFGPIEEATLDTLTVGSKIRDLTSYTKSKLSTTIVAAYLKLLFGEGVIKSRAYEYNISSRAPSSDMQLIVEAGSAITPLAFSDSINPTTLTFERSDDITFEGSVSGIDYNIYNQSDIANMQIYKIITDTLKPSRGMVFVGHKYLKKYGLYYETDQGLTRYTAMVMEAGDNPPSGPSWDDYGTTINRLQATLVGIEGADDFYEGQDYSAVDYPLIDTVNGVIRNINMTQFNSSSSNAPYVYIFFKAYTYRFDAIAIGSADESQGVPYVKKGSNFLPVFTTETTLDGSNKIIDVSIVTDYDITDYENISATEYEELTHDDIRNRNVGSGILYPEVQDTDSALYYFFGKPIFVDPTLETLVGWYDDYKQTFEISPEKMRYGTGEDDFVDNRKFVQSISLLESVGESNAGSNTIKSAQLPKADNIGTSVPLMTNQLTGIAGWLDDTGSDRVYEFYYHYNGNLIYPDDPQGTEKRAYVIYFVGSDQSFTYENEAEILLNVSLGDAIAESELTASLLQDGNIVARTLYLPAIAANEISTFYFADDGSSFYDANFTIPARLNPDTIVNQEIDNGYGIKTEHIQGGAIGGGTYVTTENQNNSTNPSTIKSNTTQKFLTSTVTNILSGSVGKIKHQSIGGAEIKPNSIFNNHITDGILNAIKLVPQSIIRSLLSTQAGYMINNSVIESAGIYYQNILRTYTNANALKADNLFFSSADTIKARMNRMESYEENYYDILTYINDASKGITISAIHPSSTYDGTTFTLASSNIILSGTQHCSIFSYDRNRATNPTTITDSTFPHTSISINVGNIAISVNKVLTVTLDKNESTYDLSTCNVRDITTRIPTGELVIARTNTIGGASALIFINGQVIVKNDDTWVTPSSQMEIGYQGSKLKRVTLNTNTGQVSANHAGNDLELVNGEFTADKVWNSVWNDYADFQELDDELVYGKCYYQTKRGAKLTTEYCQNAVLGIASDTFGHAVGIDKYYKKQVPLGVSGFVLAHVDKEYVIGTPLTCTVDGMLTEMKVEEKRDFPERIVGTFHKVEKRKEVGLASKKIKVNGRYWIKVK